MKKGLVLPVVLLALMLLVSGCAEEALTADDHYDQDHDHDEEITVFEIIDRRAEEVTAYVHVDHWHGSLPVIPAGENISLGAYVEENGKEVLLDGNHHALGVALADGAEEDIVSLNSHGDHVHIIGEQEGETLVVFQFIHDGDVEYETPPIAVAVGHNHDHSHSHDHDHGDEPYEFSGIFALEKGTYTMEFQESGDPSIEIAFVSDGENRGHSDHIAHHIWEEDMEALSAGESFTVELNKVYTLELKPNATIYTFNIAETGEYLLYLEHMPWEFDLKFYDQNGKEVVPVDTVEY